MSWKMYALKGDEKLDQVWEICIARSAEEAAKVFDRYFYHGTPWSPPPMDPSEIEPLNIKTLDTHYDGVISLDKYQKKYFPIPCYYAYYSPNRDEWVLPDPDRFEYLYGFKHPEMRYQCEECGGVFPDDEWIFHDGKRYCSQFCIEESEEEEEG